MELNYFSWEAFRRTGDIEAYLLYKSTEEPENFHDKEENAVLTGAADGYGNY